MFNTGLTDKACHTENLCYYYVTCFIVLTALVYGRVARVAFMTQQYGMFNKVLTGKVCYTEIDVIIMTRHVFYGIVSFLGTAV